MWRDVRSRKMSMSNLFIISISYLNFSVWLIFGYIFMHRDFENHEIVFSLLILMLNTVVAISVIFLSFLLWEGKRGSLYCIAMLPGILLSGAEFIIIYPNINEIFYGLPG